MIMLEDVWEQSPAEKARVIRNNRICLFVLKKVFYKFRRKIKKLIFS